jgi:hypothetical protein
VPITKGLKRGGGAIEWGNEGGVTQRHFPFSRRGRGRPWGRHEVGLRWQLACSASVREDEEGGMLGQLGQKAEWDDWLLG